MNYSRWNASIHFGSLLPAAGFAGCSRCECKTMSTDTDESEFKVGEAWNYKTRPGDEASTLVVLKVETAPGWKTSVRAGIAGLKVKEPKGAQHSLQHIPSGRKAVQDSFTSEAYDHGKLTDFQDGSGLRKGAASPGKAGVFTISVAEVVATVEEVLKKGQVR